MKTQDKTATQQKANSSSAHTVSTKALQKKAVGVVQKVEPEEEVQQQQSDGTVQKMDAPELDEEHPVGVTQQKHQQAEVNAIPVQRQENKTGMPDNLKSGIENLSGMSMDHVKVHYNSSQPAQLNALAYAQGSDIHVAPGQEKHLPHEAWHVVQQAQGRVQPTTQMKAGVPVNDDPGLEHEADVMGDKALSAPGISTLSAVAQPKKNYSLVPPVVQKRVAIAIRDKAAEDDAVILSNIAYATSYAGGSVVDLGGSADFSTMNHGEDLMIVEHGSPGGIQGGFNASVIAGILTDDADEAGGRKKSIPKTIAGISLLSCFAADPKIPGSVNTSLVAGLASELSQRGYDIVVDGKFGPALSSVATGERSVKSDSHSKAQYFTIQNTMVKKYGFDNGEQVDARYIPMIGIDTIVKIKTGSKILEENGFTPASMSVEEKSQEIARIMTPFYIDLIATASASLYDEFKGEQYAYKDTIHNYL
jgi:hypothetical protein